MSLAELIDFARKEPKEKLSLLARREIGCGLSTLDNYLHGRTTAGPKLLKKISLFLKCRASDLPAEIPKQDKAQSLNEGPQDRDWSIMFTNDQLNQKVIEVLQDADLPLEERHRRAEMILVKLRERLPI